VRIAVPFHRAPALRCFAHRRRFGGSCGAEGRPKRLNLLPDRRIRRRGDLRLMRDRRDQRSGMLLDVRQPRGLDAA
jgi:hypothetical protein